MNKIQKTLDDSNFVQTEVRNECDKCQIKASLIYTKLALIHPNRKSLVFINIESVGETTKDCLDGIQKLQKDHPSLFKTKARTKKPGFTR